MGPLTEQQFLKEVETHIVEVLRDDGVYRHIRFREPGTMMQHFDLITWPGYLCYCGDMGTYVFTRLYDMFEFFRTDRKYSKKRLGINLGYWSEKLQAVDGNRHNAGAKTYSEEKLRQVVNQYRVNWIRESARNGSLDKEQRRELWNAVDDCVLSYADDEIATTKAYDFNHSENGRDFYFQDLFEHDFTDYTHRFLWCCYALAWGIEQYDGIKEVSSV